MYSYLKNVFWLPLPNIVRLNFSKEVPNLEKVASVFVYAFDEAGKLLMIQEKKGTWDVPGGGRDVGETIEQTAQRETMEEAYASISDIRIIGYQHLCVNGEKPEKYRRPFPEAYEVFVCAKVAEKHEFQSTNEAVDRKMFSIEEAIKEDGILFENRHIILEKCLKMLK